MSENHVNEKTPCPGIKGGFLLMIPQSQDTLHHQPTSVAQARPQKALSWPQQTAGSQAATKPYFQLHLAYGSGFRIQKLWAQAQTPALGVWLTLNI